MYGYTYYIKKMKNHYNSFHIHATILVTNNLIEIMIKFLFFFSFFFSVLNTNNFIQNKIISNYIIDNT